MIAATPVRTATLIMNPVAGRLSATTRHDVAESIRKHFNAEIFETVERGDAMKIATDAARAGVDLVISFGGDGNVNEVANGVAGTQSALGIVPGGTMNVFARALGIPIDQQEAVAHLVAATSREPRMVPLGKMDDRYFTFSAGCGFDAEAAERVERDQPAKRRFGEVFFYWSAFRVLTTSYRHRNPSMVAVGRFGRIPVSMAIACNVGPYAYIAGRSVAIAPHVELEKDLDLFALRRMRIEALPVYAWRTAISGSFSGHPDVVYEHDVDEFRIEAAEPVMRHVDGEPLAPAESATFSIERDVLRVYS